MHQVFQNLKTGDVLLEDLPAPGVRPGHLLIRTTRSLISAGTERSLLEFGRASLVNKARQQPDRVRQTLRMMGKEGVLGTMRAVSAKLGHPMPLGYSNVGQVLDVGEDVEGFRAGDRVVCNGRHAELVCVPRNLCAPIPDEVQDEEAVFTVVASIGLQGIRLLKPSLGETHAVFGLGLIGQLAAQLLRLAGVRVLGFDIRPERVELARSLGIEAMLASEEADPVQAGLSATRGIGVDGVLIAASSPKNTIVHQAAAMSRKRGRIVLTGVVGLQLERADFYEKELTFQVSCSYGPGRYDPTYEAGGQDYPIAFVRWTLQRHFRVILDFLRRGDLVVSPLISARFSLSEAMDAYQALLQGEALGILLEYPSGASLPVAEGKPARTLTLAATPRKSSDSPIVGVIGAGNFATLRILPCLGKARCQVKWIASQTGASAAPAARKYGIERSTTDYAEILGDSAVEAVFIATRHNLHARMAVESLKAGKAVFVEKPLCLTRLELDEIRDAFQAASERGPSGAAPLLMVGFNRRFAPLAQSIKRAVERRHEPIAMDYLCNAGRLPSDHWSQDAVIGGGRVLGEACHFIDFFRYLSGCDIRTVQSLQLGGNNLHAEKGDVAVIQLRAQDGSIGSIQYFANGDPRFSKEIIRVFFDGNIFHLDDFQRLRGYGKAHSQGHPWSQRRKGRRIGFQAFLEAVRSGTPSPIGFDEIVNSTEAALAAVESLKTGRAIVLPEGGPE